VKCSVPLIKERNPIKEWMTRFQHEARAQGIEAPM